MPSIATGRTGAPVRIASRATPVRPRYSRPSGERVPSGWIANTPPSSSTRAEVSSASRAARPPDRSTAMAPTLRKNVAITWPRMPPPVKYSCLPRKWTRRGTISGSTNESRNARWLAARITGPVRGTCQPAHLRQEHHTHRGTEQDVLEQGIDQAFVVHVRRGYGACTRCRGAVLLQEPAPKSCRGPPLRETWLACRSGSLRADQLADRGRRRARSGRQLRDPPPVPPPVRTR